MKFRHPVLALALVFGLSVSLVGCSKINNLKARKAFKEANARYASQDYPAAAEHYEQVLAEDPEGVPADPDLVATYFYLGNSYDNQYRATRKGEAENDAFLAKAIDNYLKSAQLETNPERKRLALEFLIAAYGPDKANEPEKAEPVARQMVEVEPDEPTNYFVLAKLYEDAGRYEEAEATYQKAIQVRSNSPEVYLQYGAYWNRQADFPKTMEMLEMAAAKEPKNPEHFHRVGTYYWEKAYRDKTLKEAEQKELVMKGLEAEDKAISLDPEHMEALTYKNILLRMQANFEKDPARQKQLIAEADRLRDKAVDIRKKRTGSQG